MHISAVNSRSISADADVTPPRNTVSPTDWQRHSTIFTIRADGTGETHERTYTACGTAPDCTFNAVLTVVAQPGGGGLITFGNVRYTDADNRVMTLSAAEHQELDPYFFANGEQAEATVDASGRLVLTPLGRLSTAGQRSPDGYTYCGPKTKPGENAPCGA